MAASPVLGSIRVESGAGEAGSVFEHAVATRAMVNPMIIVLSTVDLVVMIEIFIFGESVTVCSLNLLGSYVDSIHFRCFYDRSN